MSLGTYGSLPAAAPRQRTFGSGLAGMAESADQEGFNLARTAATNENNLNLAKDRYEAEKKAGNAQLGSTVGGLAGGAIAGATWGSAAGPYGSAIGAVLGAFLASRHN